MTCGYCKTAPAIGRKIEVSEEYDADNDNAIEVKTEHLICQGCDDYWFDGTEPHPGILPL